MRLRISLRRRKSRLAHIKREQQDQHILRVPKARRICWILLCVWLLVMALTASLLTTDMWS